jgi:hypothetical protein
MLVTVVPNKHLCLYRPRCTSPIAGTNSNNNHQTDTEFCKIKDNVCFSWTNKERGQGKYNQRPPGRQDVFKSSRFGQHLNEQQQNSTHFCLSNNGPLVHDAKSTRIKNGATFGKKWSPLKGVDSPAVIRVLTHTANTGATSGSNHVMSNKRCLLWC